MKILVIGHTYIAPINREKWKVFSNKFPCDEILVLIPKKWKATLFDIDSGDLEKYSTKNCKFIALDIFKSGNEVLYRYKFNDLAKVIKNFKPDLIHVEQGDNAFSYFQAILLAKIFCRKAKFSFFSWVNWKPKRSLKYKLFWSFIEKFNLLFSSGAIVGNEDAKKVLLNKKFKKPIKVLLQLGVNQNIFLPAKKISRAKNNIGFLGRLMPEKGIFLLLNAFADLVKKFDCWNLIFVGNGKSEKELKDYIVSKDLQDRVFIRSAVSHEKIPDALNEFDILVLPSYDTASWREQFGHVLIEAMSLKVPVVGSTGGYIPGVIGDAGLVFEQKNKEGLKSCLDILMQDEKLRLEFGKKGFVRYKQNFSYEIIAEKTKLFWNKL